TSGHGVCGLGRVSARSLVAVLVFMAASMLAAFVTRHLLGVAS
ncbi:MAG TPA: YeeE/YedE family protein, partial [Burkholderiales bacterium]|nr:YeeE/YedE family protein [Burkholderiales bacterium]